MPFCIVKFCLLWYNKNVDRYLCLDIGDKRIGVAVSDPFNSYALPIETYHRQNLKKDLIKIAEYVKAKGVNKLVCGLPVNFDGTPSIQTEKANFFIERLKENLSVEIFTVDERCSTCEAEETLIFQGKSREERKSCVDALAAATILEGFLSDLNRKLNKKGDNTMSDKEKKTCNCGEDCCSHDHADELCDCYEEDIVELTTDDGKKLKFYFVGTIEYKGKTYSAFEPAEEIEGMSEDDLVIFEVQDNDENTSDLLPIEDEALLEEVFEEFCRALDEEEAAEEAESLE